jgi:hypothetical protein
MLERERMQRCQSSFWWRQTGRPETGAVIYAVVRLETPRQARAFRKHRYPLVDPDPVEK